jgi:hypothetical protein
MNCQRARVLSRMRRCEALAEDVGLPLDRLRAADKQERGRYKMKCQRCEALADHVGLLLKENQTLRERVAELERPCRICSVLAARVAELEENLEAEKGEK